MWALCGCLKVYKCVCMCVDHLFSFEENFIFFLFSNPVLTRCVSCSRSMIPTKAVSWIRTSWGKFWLTVITSSPMQKSMKSSKMQTKAKMEKLAVRNSLGVSHRNSVDILKNKSNFSSSFIIYFIIFALQINPYILGWL